MIKKPEYIPTDRERAFLDTVEDTRHEREIVNGLTPFFKERAPEDMRSFYSEDELVKLRVLNARGNPPKSPLNYKTEREEWNKWKEAVPADVPVTNAWSVPSDIQYIWVTGDPDTCWMKVVWTGAAAP